MEFKEIFNKIATIFPNVNIRKIHKEFLAKKTEDNLINRLTLSNILTKATKHYISIHYFNELPCYAGNLDAPCLRISLNNEGVSVRIEQDDIPDQIDNPQPSCSTENLNKRTCDESFNQDKHIKKIKTDNCLVNEQLSFEEPYNDFFMQPSIPLLSNFEPDQDKFNLSESDHDKATDPTVKSNSRKTMKCHSPKKKILDQESYYDDSKVEQVYKISNGRGMKVGKLLTKQRDFINQFCKSSLSEDEVRNMRDEFIKISDVSLAYTNIFDGISKYRDKFEKFQSENEKIRTKFETLEKNLNRINDIFINSITHDNCSNCPVHCISVLNREISLPAGRPIKK